MAVCAYFVQMKILAKNMFFVLFKVNLCLHDVCSQRFLGCDRWLSAGLVRMNACPHRGTRL